MHLLVLGAWPELANQLVGLPARVSLLQAPGAADAREAAWAHRYVEVDYTDLGQGMRAAAEIHAEDPVDLVIGLREASLAVVGEIARKLGVPSMPGPVESLGADKAEVRRLLNGGGCHPVPYRVCRWPDELTEFVSEHGFPAIVKPANGFASFGVHTVTGPDDVGTAWAHASDVGFGAVLAEKLLTGQEYSVETLSVDGGHEVVAVTEKLTTGAPHFVETGHIVPARLDTPALAAVGEEAVRALTAIGHRLGPCHVEIIRTGDGPAVIEINRRLGGDRIWELVQLATGRDMAREALLHAAGVTFEPAKVPPNAAVIRYLYSTVDARCVTTLPHNAAAGVPGLVRVEFSVAAGARVRPVLSSKGRLGYVLVHGVDSERAVQAAAQAYDAVTAALLR